MHETTQTQLMLDFTTETAALKPQLSAPTKHHLFEHLRHASYKQAADKRASNLGRPLANTAYMSDHAARAFCRRERYTEVPRQNVRESNSRAY